ncbi:MAG: MMPL family transporter [Bacillus sp. (in: Bacteria)]|nr:MMPL family transporter [Bacillus sp. (in: firmicutes)]
MKYIVQLRWLVLILWVLCGGILAWKAPSLNLLVREKGQISVPNGYPSAIASQIKDRHNPDQKETANIMVVFHQSHKFNQADMDRIEHTIHRLNDNKESLHITKVISQFDHPSLKKALVSKDQKTVMTRLTVNLSHSSLRSVRKQLQKAIQTPGIQALMTSSSLINQDVADSSQKGLKRTELITVVFILIVLVLVYRSIIAPFIPLITVALAYMMSQFILAVLVDRFNFPISNFTQIFLVAILFGIGTDYCILLLSRFKEELSKGRETLPAIINTYKSAGKTVLISGIAVMIGFASIGLATFKLYQSAAAVAIGVAILLMALFSVIPFFMAVLKKNLFWPTKGEITHNESKIWTWLGKIAIARPFIALGIVIIIVMPLLISYNGKISFNSLNEIGKGYDSVKAFNMISTSFGADKMMPVEVVIENDESMKSKDYLALIEKISANLASLKNVQEVQSPTRPAGKVIQDIYIHKQAKTISNGIKESNDGLRQIKSGLNTASDSVANSKAKIKAATDGIDDLQSGTSKIQSGMTNLQAALSNIETGMRDGSQGAHQLKSNVQKAQVQAEQLQAGFGQLLLKYQDAQKSIKQYIKESNQLPSDIPSELDQLQSNYNRFLKGHPEIKKDPQFQQLQQSLEELGMINSEVPSLIMQLDHTTSKLEAINTQLQTMSNGLSQFVNGFTPVINGLNQLEQGIDKAANAQNQVINKIPAINHGLKSISDGQAQLRSGLSHYNGQLDQLSNGLNSSVDGLGHIESGLDSAQSFLADLSADQEGTQGIYIPDQLLNNVNYQKALGNYISPDGKMVRINIILTENPYSNEAIDMINHIHQSIKDSTKNTKLENAHVGIDGVTSINHDLRSLSKNDYTHTVILMLAGAAVALIIFLRSIIMPIYILVSLLITYYASMAVTELIFIHLGGYSGLSWAVPFFGFVILIALGIDYSIFLMERFNEYQALSVADAILYAMKNMGTVIISAVIILSGTFAAMLPSGVLTLMQIATLTLTGLLFYTFLVLPLLIPVIAKTLGKVNWWPFIANK